jgi:hypothetical protein
MLQAKIGPIGLPLAGVRGSIHQCGRNLMLKGVFVSNDQVIYLTPLVYRSYYGRLQLTRVLG